MQTYQMPQHTSPLQPNLHTVSIKPRLIDLLNKHRINTIHLACAARLRLDTVRAIALQYKPVQPVVAMQVLHGLWELTGRQYMLVDIDMPILSYN